MPDERDDLPRPEYQRRCDVVYWRHAPSCGSKGPHGADRLLGENRELHARVEALEAFSLREGKDGRTLLMYEHADGEACVVAELTCPAVAEVASVLWPTTDTVMQLLEEPTDDA